MIKQSVRKESLSVCHDSFFSSASLLNILEYLNYYDNADEQEMIWDTFFNYKKIYHVINDRYLDDLEMV